MGSVNCKDTSCGIDKALGCNNREGENRENSGIAIKGVNKSLSMANMACITSQPVVKYRNNTKYQGEVTDSDERDGFGRLIFPDGSELVGEWGNNKLNGPALISLSSGDIIEGEWKDNSLCKDSAKFFYPDGVSWDGFSFEGSPRTMAIDFNEEGPIYIGQFKSTDRNGMGHFFRADGSVYRVAII